MKIKIMFPNRDGRLEFTKQELEKLLEEAYNEGYRDGSRSNSSGTISYYGGLTGSPSISYCTADNSISVKTIDDSISANSIDGCVTIDTTKLTKSISEVVTNEV